MDPRRYSGELSWPTLSSEYFALPRPSEQDSCTQNSRLQNFFIFGDEIFNSAILVVASTALPRHVRQPSEKPRKREKLHSTAAAPKKATVSIEAFWLLGCQASLTSALLLYHRAMFTTDHFFNKIAQVFDMKISCGDPTVDICDREDQRMWISIQES
jgi:hypothetical protein